MRESQFPLFAWRSRPRGAPDLVTAFLAVAFGLLAVPTLVSLTIRTWSQDFEAYGPIVLVTGLWLLGRQWPQMRRAGRPGALWLTVLLLTASVVSYVFGRAYDFITLETGGVFGVGVAILQSRVGVRALLAHWFPLLYLAFVVPLPHALLLYLTAPLKTLVSVMATDWLHLFGLPVGRQGVTIFVAQYQFLVEDVCSGMNSIVGLTAISLLYIYLIRKSSAIYSAVLVLCILPVAIFANIIRIIILVLLTCYAGDEAAQGFLHVTAGMVLFTTALLCVFGLDHLMAYAWLRPGRGRWGGRWRGR